VARFKDRQARLVCAVPCASFSCLIVVVSLWEAELQMVCHRWNGDIWGIGACGLAGDGGSSSALDSWPGVTRLESSWGASCSCVTDARDSIRDKSTLLTCSTASCV
jgi:hypothetical protein